MAIDQFDAVFQQAASGTSVPPMYLRATAIHESNLNPKAIGAGKEIGLMQIALVTLARYNRETGQSVTAEQAQDPLTNSKIAVWLIQEIVKSFALNHPTMVEDWKNERYVGLVTQAYNVGESETSGVGAIIGRMEKQGISQERITAATVAQANSALKINKWASEPKRLVYVNRVVSDYMRFISEAKGASKEPELAPIPKDLPAPSIVPTTSVPATGGPSIKKY